MFTFCGVAEDAERLARRIRKVLAHRHAMHIGELHMRLGTEWTALQSELAAMMESGEVERLRPVDYPREDHDFFRVKRGAAASVKFDDRWVLKAAEEGRQHVRLAGKAVACRAD